MNLTNVALPLWALVVVLVLFKIGQAVLFLRLARKLLPRALAALDRPTTADDFMPEEIKQLFTTAADHLNAELNTCGHIAALPVDGEEWSEAREHHRCSLQKGHAGDHQCRCGRTWAPQVGGA